MQQSHDFSRNSSVLLKSNMRKLFFFIIFFSSAIGGLWATTQCPLEGTLSTDIKTYLSNLDSILSDIDSVSSWSKCQSFSFNPQNSWLTGDANRTIRALIASVNSAWSFDGFQDSFRFWSDNLLSTGMPQITAKAKKALESARTKITSRFRILSSQCAWEKQFLGGSIDVPYFREKNIETVLSLLLINQIRIEHLFYRATLDDPNGPTQQELIEWLTPWNLETDIRQSYASIAVSQCKSVDGTLENIGERMKKIFSKGINIDTTQSSWKDSWAMLNGSYDTAKMRELERKLLIAEMQRQGMSSAWTRIILNNLDRYNRTGNRFDSKIWPSSFITGLGNIQKITRNLYATFESAIAKSPNTDVLVRNMRNLEYRRNMIQTELNLLYGENLERLTANDALSIDQKTTTDLIALHSTLMNINKVLVTEWIPKAESLCRSELTGYWICSYR